MLALMPIPDLLHPAALAPDAIRPLHVDEYMRLSEMGAFDDQKVELLGGVVVAVMSQGEDHVDHVTLLTRYLARRLRDEFLVAPQCTFRLSDYSAPEPDFVIVTAESFRTKPKKAVWMVEVSTTSQRKDLGLKAALYAEAGIPEYWVIDTEVHTVHIHRDPSPDGYRSITMHAGVAPQIMPTLAFTLDDLLAMRLS
jgi:Uma2 family endonuclease